jgi:hypothetical protein
LFLWWIIPILWYQQQQQQQTIMKLEQNQVEILEISRPNPNPRNIEGKALLNGWKVAFSLMEEANGHLRPKAVYFPKNVSWDKIIKGSTKTGHKYYANLVIIQKIRAEKLIR